MFNPRKLKIKSLPKGKKEWRDNDHVMLHACFALLVDFVENERAFDCHVEWEFNEESQKAKNEILELYNWWKKRIEKSEYGDDDYYDENSDNFAMKNRVWADPNKKDFEVNIDGAYEKENEMLHRLINVRKYLWT